MNPDWTSTGCLDKGCRAGLHQSENSRGSAWGKQGAICPSQSFLGDLSNLRHPSAPQLPSDDPLMAFAVEVLSLRNQALMDRPGPQGLALLADGIA
ncbi:hypothetical protein PMIT1306_00730 [Prochlorococcus sp. MIT 1306]|nr:hypothetical protein PMIT1306_00730 [Prochlorococcus sp. MIT 1306]